MFQQSFVPPKHWLVWEEMHPVLFVLIIKIAHGKFFDKIFFQNFVSIYEILINFVFLRNLCSYDFYISNFGFYTMKFREI